MNLLEKLDKIGTIVSETETNEGYKELAVLAKELPVPCLKWIMDHFEMKEIQIEKGMFALTLVL